MATLFIRRCVLRIVRSGGWTWGDARDALVRPALATLVNSLTQMAEGFAEPSEETSIDAPVRVDIRLTPAELVALVAGPAEPHSNLSKRLKRALAAALQPHLHDNGTGAPASSEGLARLPVPGPSRRSLPWRERDARVSTDSSRSISPEPDAIVGSSVLALLLRWHEMGRLGLLLQTFSLATLSAWHAAVFDGPASRFASSGPLPDRDAVAATVLRISRLDPEAPLSQRRLLALRIAAAIEIVSEFQIAPSLTMVRNIVDRVLPNNLASEVETVAEEANEVEPRQEPRHEGSSRRRPFATSEFEPPTSTSPEAASPAPPLHASGSSPVGYSRWPAESAVDRFETPIDHALPFLLLGPLERMGALDAWSAAAEAADCHDGLPELAAALAHKVLPMPQRGWLRTAATNHSAGVFAGRRETRALTAEHDSLFEPILAASEDAIRDGHLAETPYFLCRPSAASSAASSASSNTGVWFLTDTDGLLPVHLSTDLSEVLGRMAVRGNSLIAVDSQCADAELLSAIAGAGLRFATNRRPPGTTDCREVHASGGMCWSNDAGMSDSVVHRISSHISRWRELADAIWEDIAVGRPASPGGTRTLEGQLTVVSGAALGALAWDLWRDHELTDPLLTIERFGDLSAVVRSTDEALTVVLPLGSRSQALAQRRLLDDIENVPWLNGRAVRFRRG